MRDTGRDSPPPLRESPVIRPATLVPRESKVLLRTTAAGPRIRVLPGAGVVLPAGAGEPRAGRFELNDLDLRRILDELHDGVYVTDVERRIVYWNRGAQRISGWAAAEVLGTRCADGILIHVNEAGEPLCGAGCPLSHAIGDGVPREGDIYLRHREGHRVPVRTRVQPLRGGDGRVIGAVETFADSTEELAALRQVEELQAIAFIDPLTGVGNRRHAEQTLHARLEELRRYGWSFGVLFLDIDHFKEVNDEFGHEVGDRVLRMVARTLSGSLRSFDFLGRWGGEEFVCVIPMQLGSQLPALAARCRALVEGSNLRVGESTVRVTISLGASMADSSDTVDGLMRRVDDLMYESKVEGRNRVTVQPERPKGR
ncbi:MAG: diguanylate cyclase [Deltaproteobacteria bacterium]|nr:diguanylate cyclase [Deltaproteobacteria bacterium]